MPRPKEFPNKPDLRGFEWYYLFRLSQRSLNTPILNYRGSVAFSREGKLVYCDGGEVKLRTLETGRVESVVKGHEGRVSMVSLSADGNTLATCAGSTVKIWNVETRRERIEIPEQVGTRFVIVSPDGRFLATSDVDQSVVLWNVSNGKEYGSLSGTPGGCRVFTAQRHVSSGRARWDRAVGFHRRQER